MKSKLLIFFILISSNLFATHNRGGHIEIKWVSGLTYEINIITITKTSSVQADRPQLDSVYIGDNGMVVVVPRDSSILLPNDVKINYYRYTHTYPGDGTYKVYFTDPNRNANVRNIPNSVAVPFYCETEFTIRHHICPSFSPQFFRQPLGEAIVGKDFRLSRAAYDVNWDSLSFELSDCRGDNGDPIVGYSMPPGVRIDPVTGEFFWDGDSILTSGEYNFAIKVKEWRNGFLNGYVKEDFQVIVGSSADSSFDFNTSIYPPDLTTHVQAGDTFYLHIEYFDSTTTPSFEFFSELDNVSLTTLTGGHWITGDLMYVTTANDARSKPYRLVFHGETDMTYLLYIDGPQLLTCLSLISVDEVSTENMFTIFPNPTTGKLYLTTEISFGDLSYTIYDMQGQLVQADRLANDQIDISDLRSGIYFIELRSGGYVQRNKIIHLD